MLDFLFNKPIFLDALFLPYFVFIWPYKWESLCQISQNFVWYFVFILPYKWESLCQISQNFVNQYFVTTVFFTKKTSTLVLWKSNNQGGLPLAYIYISGYTDSKWGSLVWKGKWLVRADKANHSVWIHSVCGPWPVSGPGPLHGPLPVLLYSSSFNNKDLLVSGFSQFGLC